MRDRTPASCRPWRVLGYNGSGPHAVDPDGPLGPRAPLTAYRDMTGDGGEWTLLRSTLSTDCLGAQGAAARGAAGYRQTATMQALTDRSGQVHIRTRDQAATRSATATRPMMAIQTLRAGRPVEESRTLSSAGAPTVEHWSGPMAPGTPWTGCAVADLNGPSA